MDAYFHRTHRLPGWIRAAVRVVFLVCMATAAHSQSFFRSGNLLAVPTTETLRRGRFVASAGGGYEASRDLNRRTAGVAFDFGVLSFLQGGIALSETERNDPALEWTLKAQLLAESATYPAFAVGASGLSNESPIHPVDAVLSKEFNLPRAGFFRLHAGVEYDALAEHADRTVYELIGAVKRWQTAYGTFRALAEWNGRNAGFGVEQRYSGGLRIGMGVLSIEDIGKENAHPQIVLSVGFGNDELLREIEAAKRLARQAAAE